MVLGAARAIWAGEIEQRERSSDEFSLVGGK